MAAQNILKGDWPQGTQAPGVIWEIPSSSYVKGGFFSNTATANAKSDEQFELLYDYRYELVENVEKKLKYVEGKLTELENLFNSLKSTSEFSGPKEIILRDISRSQAKREVAEFFENHHGENIDPADLEEALGIDIMLAVEICDELENEGKIKAA